QNAKDRTIASAYSVRPTPQATVSAPLDWSEVPDCEPADFTLINMPRRYQRAGDRHAGIDERAGSGERGRGQPSKRKLPVMGIGRAKHREDALAGLERWRKRHPEAAKHLEPADVLVDSMRGRYTTWTRIRVNLQHVPQKLRPAQEPLDPDEKTLSSS